MRKLDYPALILENIDELRKRERSEKEARIRLRVQLLRRLKNRETDLMKEACRICGITPKHGYDLWKKYREKGLNALLRFDWKPPMVSARKPKPEIIWKANLPRLTRKAAFACCFSA